MHTLQAVGGKVYVGEGVFPVLGQFISEGKFSSVFILAGDNALKHCVPVLKSGVSELSSAPVIGIPSGEKNKTIETCCSVWSALAAAGADRKALLVNVGGGVTCDLGGFTASTYKRGIRFIHVPTTLLSQADACLGGKTGVDFGHLKNMVGAFAFPPAIFVHPGFLRTLDHRQIRSGYAEIIKQALLAEDFPVALSGLSDPEKLISGNGAQALVYASLSAKNEIVISDPQESGYRKVLNFGHTIGHAYESLSLEHDADPLLHGEAVAGGMIAELFLSNKICGFPETEMSEIIACIQKNCIVRLPVDTADETLLALMGKDKKNAGSSIRFTLLKSVGDPVTDQSCTPELVREALAFCRRKTAG